MRLNQTTMGVRVLVRRNSSLQAKRTNNISARYLSTSYRPLYCVKNNESEHRIRGEHNMYYQQQRFANTSSGFFAPATSSHRKTSDLEGRGNLNVFEDSDHLPSLPVPSLDATLNKLKETISPVAMNSTEFISTLNLIDKFAKSAGPKLDLFLRSKAGKTKNWLTLDWWLQEVYLKSRAPLVINSNPSMIYPTLPYEVNNQKALVNVISQLISGMIDFKLALINGYNPEATSANNEYRLDPNLCYHQYKNLFGTTRLPDDNVDTLHKLNHLESITPFNLIVSYKGKFFEIQLNNIEDEKGRIDQIKGILDKIISTGIGEIPTNYGNSCSIHDGAGVLTTANRSDWAQAFRLLDADSIKAIKGSQFVVCLDTIETSDSNDKFVDSFSNSPTGSEPYMAALNRQILHSNNSNVGNRWFDKSLQLIVVADEKAEKYFGAGLNYEHSCGEAMLVTKLIEYSFDKILQKHRESSSVTGSSNFFAKEEFSTQLPAVFRQLRMFDDNNIEKINHIIKQTKQDYASQIDQFELSYFDYKQYGSNAIKSWRFSPDSWFQVAMQSAYYKLHKRLGPCYESASTRRFAYGRTETIRSLTKDVSMFCLEPSFDTMQTAIKSHKTYAISAINGEAIDRVLLGYRMAFKELRSNKWTWGLPELRDNFQKLDKLAVNRENIESIDGSSMEQSFRIEDLFTEDELNTIGAFFNSELIKRTTRFALSTSQVSSIHPNICLSYGPILTDGYGCCYNITGQKIVAAITANSSNKFFSCEVNEFNSALGDSLDNMKEIVEEQQSRLKS